MTVLLALSGVTTSVAPPTDQPRRLRLPRFIVGLWQEPQ